MSRLKSLPRWCLILKIVQFSGCSSFHLKSLHSTCISAAGHSRGHPGPAEHWWDSYMESSREEKRRIYSVKNKRGRIRYWLKYSVTPHWISHKSCTKPDPPCVKLFKIQSQRENRRLLSPGNFLVFKHRGLVSKQLTSNHITPGRGHGIVLML